MFSVPEKLRVKTGMFASTEKAGNNGQFRLKSLKLSGVINAVVSDKVGWEHVSVSMPTRCPTWEDMCIIKDMFWDEDDAVIQIHPPKSEYINCHKYCLHLWRKKGTNDFYEAPPKIMVGV